MPVIVPGESVVGTTATDLASYLGRTLDTDRADLALALARAAVIAEVGHEPDPFPDLLSGLVLSVAGRAYLNPGQLRTSATGPFQATFTETGVSLSAAERRLARRFRRGSPVLSVPLRTSWPAETT